MHPSSIWAAIMQPGELPSGSNQYVFVVRYSTEQLSVVFKTLETYQFTIIHPALQYKNRHYSLGIPNNRSLSGKSYGGNIGVITLQALAALICLYRKYIQVMSKRIREDTCETFTFISKVLTTPSSMSNTSIQQSSL